ncbi:MAG: hypothetical protein IPK04_15365 [Bdellovibrionales bacterium]|nr:hypothetical protein [Bdellovibrionales bacterium]
MLAPTLGAAGDVADTSELFLRGFQLLNLFNGVDSKISDRPANKSENIISRNEILKIELIPQDAGEFKAQLLSSKVATIEVIFDDGKIEQKIWNAANMTSESNVLGNLRSRPDFRSGKWQASGISSIRVKAA